jgi:predicted DNA-binding ribbon-helix-helix protein
LGPVAFYIHQGLAVLRFVYAFLTPLVNLRHLTLSRLISYIYMELLVKPENLTSYVCMYVCMYIYIYIYIYIQ